MGMFFYKTSPCSCLKHPDVLMKNIPGVFHNGVVLFIDVGIRYTVHYIGIYLN